MGTRSLTTFIETYKDKDEKVKKTKIVTMYKQYDGYPEGYGLELAEFLAQGKLVNGFGRGEDQLQFNGMGCLSAQVVAHFKDGTGGIYLHRGGTKDCGEEFHYEVIGGSGTAIIIRVLEVGYMKGDKYCKGMKELFKGTPQEFLKSSLVATE